MILKEGDKTVNRPDRGKVRDVEKSVGVEAEGRETRA